MCKQDHSSSYYFMYFNIYARLESFGICTEEVYAVFGPMTYCISVVIPEILQQNTSEHLLGSREAPL